MTTLYLKLATAAVFTIILCFMAWSVCHLVFHPLAKYPGPKLAALTDYWYAFTWASGRYPYVLQGLHEEYGDVVRIGPNKLSFATTQAHHDIYEQHKLLFRKSDWYSGGIARSILFERDPVVHAELKNALKPNFGPQYLKHSAEDFILELMKKIPRLLLLDSRPSGINGEGDGGSAGMTRSVDVSRLFTMFSFDVIGMITLGKSFDGLATDTLHPLAELMHSGAYAATLKPMRERLWLFDKAIRLRSRGSDPDKLRAQHLGILIAEVKQRMALGTTSEDDVVARVTRQNSLDLHTLVANIVILAIAGSETLATCLSATMYLLLKNRHCLAKLKEEVRSAFATDAHITGETTTSTNLPYLRAVIDETLRVLPPSPVGLSRICPGAVVDGRWIPKGVDVSVDVWSLQHSARYWKDPMSFRPERWYKSNPDEEFADERVVKEAFRPFSAGPRVCTGQALAYLEMRIVLAKLVWLYDWELDPQSEGWLEKLTLEFFWRKPELLIRFVPRHAT
ncbi:cytochrome P450 [Xylariaceae sp. FL0594]|nr:cytochrome P450 [Xylariaceae sp. FL0594]